MKKQFLFEQAIFTSIDRSDFQASSKGMKKIWEKELRKRCEYTHNESLNMNNPDHMDKLPEIYRSYSIPDEKNNFAFFISRTSYGQKDSFGRMASITHIVHLEEKLFFNDNIIPYILCKLIPWSKSYEGKSGQTLPLLKMDINDYDKEINKLQQCNLTEINMEDVGRMMNILLNADSISKRIFFIYLSDYKDNFFKQFGLCFYLLPAFAIKKLSFTINDYYPPKTRYNIILFDPEIPLISIKKYNALTFKFPNSKDSNTTKFEDIESVSYLISCLKANNFSEISRIKDKMDIFTDWELTPENFQIIFAFTFHILKIKELDALPSYPSSFSAWIEIVKAFQLKKDKDGLQKQLFLECCEKWLLNEPDTIITKLKPEIIVEIFTQWFLLLDDQVVNSQFFNKWIDIAKAFQSKKDKITVQRQLFLEFFEKMLFKHSETLIPNMKPEVIMGIFTQWFLLLDNQRFTPQFQQFLLVLFSNLIISKNWHRNEVFKEKMTRLIINTFQSENQYIELLEIFGELYKKIDRNNQYAFLSNIEPLFMNNPNENIRTYCFKYLFDHMFLAYDNFALRNLDNLEK